MPDGWSRPLPADTVLHACLTCGGAVPAKGLGMHETWHRNIAAAAIDAHRRLDRLTNPPRPPYPTNEKERHG